MQTPSTAAILMSIARNSSKCWRNGLGSSDSSRSWNRRSSRAMEVERSQNTERDHSCKFQKFGHSRSFCRHSSHHLLSPVSYHLYPITCILSPVSPPPLLSPRKKEGGGIGGDGIPPRGTVLPPLCSHYCTRIPIGCPPSRPPIAAGALYRDGKKCQAYFHKYSQI